jgi:tRNA (cytidine/uridine-2'-O-)-methyltransferase
MAPLRLALYQPDIPQNTGALLRTAACLAVPVDIIEPCGFILDDKRMRRAGMDYMDRVVVRRHAGWQDFQAAYPGCRRVLLTTQAETVYTDFRFAAGDILLTGRESAGVPDDIHGEVEARITIPMAPELRSLNLAAAAAMVLGEALRQLDAFPEGEP